VIGWVGQSGLATGAHLHFAIFDKGRYVNPLTIRRPPQIASIDRGKLEIVKAAMSEKLRAIQGPYRVLPSTPPLALSTLTQTRQLGPVVLTI
jgi:murein DD-endopeptidase MepM/ murein hydrolase activator NlpD